MPTLLIKRLISFVTKQCNLLNILQATSTCQELVLLQQRKPFSETETSSVLPLELFSHLKNASKYFRWISLNMTRRLRISPSAFSSLQDPHAHTSYRNWDSASSLLSTAHPACSVYDLHWTFSQNIRSSKAADPKGKGWRLCKFIARVVKNGARQKRFKKQ